MFHRREVYTPLGGNHADRTTAVRGSIASEHTKRLMSVALHQLKSYAQSISRALRVSIGLSGKHPCRMYVHAYALFDAVVVRNGGRVEMLTLGRKYRAICVQRCALY